MDVVPLGPLRARRVVKTASKVAANPSGSLTVVLMHGYGAPGDDLVSLTDVIEAPAGTTFLFPEAPSSLDDPAMLAMLGDARMWWPIDAGRFQRATMTGEVEELVTEVPEGIAEARASVLAMLDSYEREAGVPGDRIVLGGFSQGSMLATDIVLRNRRPVAGLVVMSGTLLAAREWLPLMAERKGLPVFQSHGTGDPLLPFAIAERLRGAFDEAGMPVTFTDFDGGHGITMGVMHDLGTWLGKRI